MKKTLLITSIFLFPIILFSQQEYMDSIVSKACECVSEIPENEPLIGENFGICILSEASKYGDELLRDYNINMLNIDVEGEELGKIVGLKMITHCPEQIKRIASSSNNSDEEVKEPIEEFDILRGKVKSVITNDFVTFSIQDTEGKISKFYWLTFVESEFNIQENFNELKGRKVEISYSIVEIFDHNLKEYRNINMIEKLSLIE